MKKLLGIITVLALTVSIVTSVVVWANPTKLDKLNLEGAVKNTSINGKDANTAETVLAKILELNSDVSASDVDIKDFVAATERGNGSAIIFAKEKSDYTGEVPITITAYEKTYLKDVIKITKIDNKGIKTPKDVLDTVIALNPDSVSSNDVTASVVRYALTGIPGTAVITANPESMFTGEVLITIKQIESPELNGIIEKIKAAQEKDKWGPSFVAEYRKYFAFIQKTLEDSFKEHPYIITKDPESITKSELFYSMEEYIRWVRAQHYQIGLPKLHITFDLSEINDKLEIDSEKKEISIKELTLRMQEYNESGNDPIIQGSETPISVVIKYEVGKI